MLAMAFIVIGQVVEMLSSYKQADYAVQISGKSIESSIENNSSAYV